MGIGVGVRVGVGVGVGTGCGDGCASVEAFAAVVCNAARRGVATMSSLKSLSAELHSFNRLTNSE